MIRPGDINKQQSFSRRNYPEVLEIITPEFYLEGDIALSGTFNDPINGIINSHIIACNNITDILDISATNNYSSIGNISGISQYFIKQNNLTKISPFDFEKKILNPLNRSISDFETLNDWNLFVSATLLPKIPLAGQKLHTENSNAFGNTSESSHEYLIDALSWFYFLNTSADATWVNNNKYDPSTYVVQSLSSLYLGKTLGIVDGVKGFQEYIWKNAEDLSSVDSRIYPDLFASAGSGGTWTSGTQQLEKIKTLIDIIYSTDSFDSRDTHVKDAFTDFAMLGTLLENKVSNGPLHKFIKAISYSMGDRMAEIEDIRNLFDIDKCPEEYLPVLAELIGWKLLGFDPERWRLQLRKAIPIYKAKGTRKSIQLMVDTVFAEGVLDIVSDNFYELYESYLPNLIYYILATDAKVFEDGYDSWNIDTAIGLGIPGHDFRGNNLDLDIKIAVDYILLDLWLFFPENFILGDTPYPQDVSAINDFLNGVLYQGPGDVVPGSNFDPKQTGTVFEFLHKGRVFPMPPWEEEKYYTQCLLNTDLFTYLLSILSSYGVSTKVIQGLEKYIEKYVFNNTEDIFEISDWLFFTSSLQLPTNYDEVMANPSTKNVEYLSLWNGKSSHISFPFEAKSFDFSKDKHLEANSYLAIKEVSKCVDEVIPAHAIANFTLSLSDTDKYTPGEIVCTDATIPSVDYVSGPYANTIEVRGSRGFASDALHNKFRKKDVMDLNASAFIASASPLNLYRDSTRRRNFKYTLPKDGLFTRDGFNMPSPYHHYKDVGRNNWLPLGYVPTTGKFQSVSSHNSLPAVWQICENLKSKNFYNEVPTSSTFPCRGVKADVSACTGYRTRGMTPDIVAYMNKFYDQSAIVYVSSLISSALGIGPTTGSTSSIYDAYITSSYYFDFLNSSANIIVSSLSSADIYENFRFGRGIHKLFKYYNTFYNSEKKETPYPLSNDITNAILTNKSRVSIFSMLFGPGLLNSDFSIQGPALSVSADLIASSYVFPKNLLSTSAASIFNTSTGPTVGTCAIPGVDDDRNNFNFGVSSIYVGDREFRNASIVSGVELICPSSNPQTNVFALVKLPYSTNKFNESLKFLEGNTLIYQRGNKGSKGIGRIAFDSHKYFNTSNVFIPEHDFRLKVKIAGGVVQTPLKKSNDNVNFKVWVHTKNEDGSFWSWTPQGVWTRNTIDQVSGIGGKSLVKKLSHSFIIPPEAFVVNLSSADPKGGFQGKSQSNLGEDNSKEDSLLEFEGLTEDSFVNFNLNFNTRNLPILVDPGYYDKHKQVHKSHQDYIFEIYLDEGKDKIIILDEVTVQDLSMYNLAKIDTAFGDVRVTQEDLFTIFRFFKSLYKGLDGDIYGVSGGSRLNYRYHPGWNLSSLQAVDDGPNIGTITSETHNQYTEIYVVN